MKLYEIWREIIDTNNKSHYEKVKTYMDKKEARRNLVEMNAQNEFENPYSLRTVVK